MAPDPSFFILPAAGVAAAVLAVWATTRGRRTKLDAAGATAAIAADLQIDPPTQVFVDAGGRCAFAPLPPHGVAVACMMGDRIATRHVSKADVESWRCERESDGRVAALLITRDFDRRTFEAAIAPEAAAIIGALLGRAAAPAGEAR